jgi:uncharacterized damage-inducible protein DinB
MTNFESEDLRGSTFHEVDLRDSRFREVWFGNVMMRGVALTDVDIDGEIHNVRINGVDVAPLVEAELDRLMPHRAKMRPTDADGFREAWTILEELWAGTVQRARTFTAEQLNESVDGEWSFIQTLRHLVYATDCWVNRVLLGDPLPFHPLDQPFDGAEPHPEVSLDIEARPSLQEVLALRADRMATVRRVLDELSNDRLADRTQPVEGPSWPPGHSYPVKEALLTVLNEEWQHRLYAERDLDVVGQRSGPEAG